MSRLQSSFLNEVLFNWLYACPNREADMTKERIEKLLKAGANVVLTTKGIDDMALKASFFFCISQNALVTRNIHLSC